MDLEQARKIEHEKYQRAYASPDYRMKGQRMADAMSDLAAVPMRGAYFDVSCGRGDMLMRATELGFDPVVGTEIVATLIDGERVIYGEVHALPFEDKSFNVVTMFDVIEHLIPGDDELACNELKRVACNNIIITANNRASIGRPYGDVLHINRREYGDWDRLLHQWFAPAVVTWKPVNRHDIISQTWRIDL